MSIEKGLEPPSNSQEILDNIERPALIPETKIFESVDGRLFVEARIPEEIINAEKYRAFWMLNEDGSLTKGDTLLETEKTPLRLTQTQHTHGERFPEYWKS